MNRIALRRILSDEGLTKLAADYYDSEGHALKPAEVAAIQANDPQALAQVMSDTLGRNAYVFLDGYGRVIRQILQDAGIENPSFRRDAEWAIDKIQSDKDDRAIATSPWKKELKALSGALTSTVTPDTAKYIRYQPRKRKGVYVSAILEDIGGHLGNMRAGIDEDWARQYGTTLKKVFEALDKLGASLGRGMGPGKKKPWIDYDGWAY
jgi:hypothetical protein